MNMYYENFLAKFVAINLLERYAEKIMNTAKDNDTAKGLCQHMDLVDAPFLKDEIFFDYALVGFQAFQTQLEELVYVCLLQQEKFKAFLEYLAPFFLFFPTSKVLLFVEEVDEINTTPQRKSIKTPKDLPSDMKGAYYLEFDLDNTDKVEENLALMNQVLEKLEEQSHFELKNILFCVQKTFSSYIHHLYGVLGLPWSEDQVDYGITQRNFLAPKKQLQLVCDEINTLSECGQRVFLTFPIDQFIQVNTFGVIAILREMEIITFIETFESLFDDTREDDVLLSTNFSVSIDWDKFKNFYEKKSPLAFYWKQLNEGAVSMNKEPKTVSQQKEQKENIVTQKSDLIFDKKQSCFLLENKKCQIPLRGRGGKSLEYRICKFLFCGYKERTISWDELFERVEETVSDDKSKSEIQKRAIKDAVKRIQKRVDQDFGVKIISFDAGIVRKLFVN